MANDKILVEKNGKKIYWRKLVPSDEAEVRRLTLECVMPREPLTATLQEVYSAEDVLRFVMPLSMVPFRQNHSIGAYDDDNKDKLCAMLILSLQVPSDEKHDYTELLEGAKAEIDSGCCQMIRYLDALGEGLDKHIGKTKSMVIEIVAVDESYLKMGIMSALTKKVEIIARENNVRYLVSLSTSRFTQQADVKLGYKELKEIKYKEYVDEATGKMPLTKPLPPHTSGKLFCLDLENQ